MAQPRLSHRAQGECVMWSYISQFGGVSAVAELFGCGEMLLAIL